MFWLYKITTLSKINYLEQESNVRTESGDREWFSIGRGFTQGYILSPYLFSMYSEYIMRRALDDSNGQVPITGQKLTNLGYTNDKPLIARSAKVLQIHIEKVLESSCVVRNMNSLSMLRKLNNDLQGRCRPANTGLHRSCGKS